MVVCEYNKADKKENFICIHCGDNVPELYKTYTSSVIKIVNCNNCNTAADKYMEFESIIILIDLILLSKPAYQHILSNTSFKNHWKLSLVVLLLESYYLWNETYINFKSNNDSIIAERKFYFCFITKILEMGLLFLVIQLLTSSTKFLLFWKGLTLANCSKFFLLPIIIWKDNLRIRNINFHTVLMIGYFTLSLIQVYSCLTRCSKRKSAAVISSSLAIKSVIMPFVFHFVNTLETIEYD